MDGNTTHTSNTAPIAPAQQAALSATMADKAMCGLTIGLAVKLTEGWKARKVERLIAALAAQHHIVALTYCREDFHGDSNVCQWAEWGPGALQQLVESSLSGDDVVYGLISDALDELADNGLDSLYPAPAGEETQ